MNQIESIVLREKLIEEIYKIMKKDKNIFFLTDDFGAKALDKLRRDFSERFINIGIAEQNLINIAIGLAYEGFTVFCYGISTFITMRCYEQLRNLSLFAELKEFNINIIGVGTGYSYELSGPTHHCVEDISIMKTLPNFMIFSPSNEFILKYIVDFSIECKKPKYIRLEGKPLKKFTYIYKKKNNFSDGLSILKEGKDFYIIGTGNMTHRAIEVAEELEKYKINAGVIDLYRIKPINSELLIEIVKNVRGIITIEEHLLAGGMGSAILEVLADNQINLPVKRFGVRDKYLYAYGGRENIQKICGLDKGSIVKDTLDWVKKI
ncbi:MAG: transketolase [Candidatus Omnitrophica bacterium]|nr:transketolase [Candidatus Omnitrophota bacterium]